MHFGRVLFPKADLRLDFKIDFHVLKSVVGQLLKMKLFSEMDKMKYYTELQI